MGCLSVQSPILVRASSSVKQLRCKLDSLPKARMSVKAKAKATGDDAEEKVAEPASTSPMGSSQSGGAEGDLGEKLKPLFDALDSTDVVLTETPLWEKYLVPIASNEYVKQAVGWKSLTEQINGRVAMIGFVGVFLGELGGGGSFLEQLSSSPREILILQAILTAASIIPVARNAESDGVWVEGVPPELKEIFTVQLEKRLGRLAMLGTTGLILIEILKGGSALF